MIRTLKMMGCCLAAAVLFPAMSFAQYDEPPHFDQTPQEYQRGRMKEPQMLWQEKEQLLRDASRVFKQLITPKARSEYAQHAKCIAVFPAVTEAAIALGVRTSSGIASCKGANAMWSQPSFIDLRGASLGVQLGAKSTQLVMFLMNDKAKRALIEGRLTLGADLSYASGTLSGDAAADTAGKDIVTLTESSGVFAGASLNGTIVNADNTSIQAFYGEDMSHSELLNTFRSNERSPASEDLKRAFAS